MTAWEREWRLNTDSKLMGDPDVSRFRLVGRDAGNFKYYLIEHEPGEMSPVWKDCVLVPRGSKPLPYVGAGLLPPWNSNDPGVVNKYKAAVDSGYKRSKADTNRLECELDFGGKKRWAIATLATPAICSPSFAPGRLTAGEADQSASVAISVPRSQASDCQSAALPRRSATRCAAAKVSQIGPQRRKRCFASGEGSSWPRTFRVAAGAAIAALPRRRSKAIMFRLVRRRAFSRVI